jgi:hypothetical protein
VLLTDAPHLSADALFFPAIPRLAGSRVADEPTPVTDGPADPTLADHLLLLPVANESQLRPLLDWPPVPPLVDGAEPLGMLDSPRC